MTMPTAMYGRLRDTAPIAAIVGTHVYVDAVPQNQPMPYIVLQEVSGFDYDTLNGPTGLAASTVQADIYAATPDVADQLLGLVRAAIAGFRGQMGDAGTEVRYASLDGRRSEALEPESSDDQWTFRRSVDFYFTYVEA